MIASKPIPAGCLRERLLRAQHLRAAGQSGETTGDEHHEQVHRETFIPAVRAAFAFAPRPRNWKPRVDLSGRPRDPAAARIATMMPHCTRHSSKIDGYSALSATGGLIGSTGLPAERGLRQQPRDGVDRDPVEHDRRDDLVSPVLALRNPAMPPQIAPPMNAPTTASSRWMNHGRLNWKPMYAAKIGRG